MRLNETRQLFEQACDYPVDRDTLLEQLGTVQLEAPTGDETAIASVFERLDAETYDSPDEVFDALVGNVGDTFVGRKYYDDRGGEAGDPHPDARYYA